MRLTCPNCDAQYEIPDDVMPENGRDVQCSNCGTTWFQAHPNAIDVNDELEDDGDDEEGELAFDAAKIARRLGGSWIDSLTSGMAYLLVRKEKRE